MPNLFQYALIALCLGGCTSAPPPTPSSPKPSPLSRTESREPHPAVPVPDYARACNDLGLTMLRRLPPTNQVCSPFAANLTQLRLGEFETKQAHQAAQVMATNPFQELRETLFVAHPSAERRESGSLEVQPLTQVAVEQWYRDTTGGKIAGTIPRGPVDALLLQAMVIDLHWTEPFEPELTRPGAFRTRRGAIQVPTMRGRLSCEVSQGSEFRLIAVSVDEPDLEFWWVLPDRDNGLDGVLRQLRPESLDRLRSRAKWMEVDLEMPRFSLFTHLSLLDPPLSLPVPQRRGGMVTQMHQVCLAEVGEKGARVTTLAESVIASATPESRPQPIPIKIDHPALFLIWHRPSGLVLAWGRLEEPRP